MAKDEEKVVATEAEAEPKAKKPAAKKAADVTAEKPAEDKKATKAEAADISETKAEVKESAAEPKKEEAAVEQTEKKADTETSAPVTAPSTTSAAPAAASSSPRPERTERSYGGGDNRGYGDRRGGPRQRRKKVCQFCVDRQDYIDYKDTGKLRKFISERAKIIPRRVTGTCARHQRELTTAIKKARQVALLPYISD